MNIMKDLKYTETHEWVRLEGNRAYVGITDHAQSQMGELVFIELPVVDDEIGKGDPLAVVESVKAASDVYAPLTGTIIEINEELEDNPGAVNEDPYQSWFAVIEISDSEEIDELMDADAYEAFCQQEE
ncbi:MAG: glycine cleavage system protein GcvH [Peptococcaceae bacterium]|nr:glycine cleavage system protein GcvH [Peptococcaceae bacterium]